MLLPPRLRSLVFCVCFLSLSGALHADLLFTAPPREGGSGGTNERAEDLYVPIADYLTTVLGEKVTYSNPGNWLNYQSQMREDKYDIIFDGPHFISWRIEHLGHEAIARMPGPLDFVLLARADDTSLSKIEDLVAHSFCSIPPPNLATLSIMEKFHNPVRQPMVKSIRGGAGEAFGAFSKGTCSAVVLRANFYAKKMTDEQRRQVKVIFKTVDYPNQGFSVSKRISAKDRAQLKRALTGEPDKRLVELIKRFGKPNDRFVPTDNTEFKGLNNLLEGVIFGW